MSWTGVRTIMVLELRQRVRATRWRVMLGIWFAVLLLLVLGTSPYFSNSVDYASVLYDVLLCFVLGIGLVVAPALSATSVNGDRADATLALLQATALRSREIVVGKLLAAWAAAVVFLAVALPFLLVLTSLGGATWLMLLGHLLVLVVTLGSVCAVGLGISALTARLSASAVLTYLVVTALTVGTPLATATAAAVAKTEQTSVHYEVDYDASTSGTQVCTSQPRTWTTTVTRTDLVWWTLAPNPFVVLSDVSARTLPDRPPYDASMLAWVGDSVNSMREPVPSRVVYDDCGEHGEPWQRPLDEAIGPDLDDATASFLPFWPFSLLVLLALGGAATEAASRRLAVPAGRLPRGTRLA